MTIEIVTMLDGVEIPITEWRGHPVENLPKPLRKRLSWPKRTMICIDCGTTKVVFAGNYEKPWKCYSCGAQRFCDLCGKTVDDPSDLCQLLSEGKLACDNCMDERYSKKSV